MAAWIFLRHGESTANAEGFLAGWEDVPLTPLGEAQARVAGELLVEARFDRVISSDLRRALSTAEMVLQQRPTPRPPLHVSAALRERNLGDWRGERLEALRADGRMAVLHGWDTRPPGGESHVDLARRALGALDALEAEVPTLFVSHGGLLRTLFGLLDGMPTDLIGRVKIPNAEPIQREIRPGTWSALLARLGAG